MFGVSHRGLLAKTYQDAPGRKPEVHRQPRAPSPEARADALEAGRQPASLEWCQGELHLHDHDGGQQGLRPAAPAKRDTVRGTQYWRTSASQIGACYRGEPDAAAQAPPPGKWAVGALDPWRPLGFKNAQMLGSATGDTFNSKPI